VTDKISPDKDLLKGGVKPNRNGRPKGALNKFTTLKQAFLDAFEGTGGAEGLITWIKANPRNRAAFYQLVTKLFPQEVAHSGAIKTNDKLLLEVVHTRPEKVEGGNGNGNGGNGGEKK
jgi:hypothetical protein